MGKGKRLRENRAASVTTTHITEGVNGRWFYILRYIATIAMLIDHLGRVLYVTSLIGAIPCVVCYIIGRIAFPLFAFELVESFYHTKHKVKHLIWLGGLALVSEIPFDMALVMTDPMKLDMETFLDVIAYQNVCFTLFFGFLMLLLCDFLDALLHRLLKKHKYLGWGLSAILKVAVYLGVGLAVGFLKTDYSWYGTTLIALFAIGRGHESSRWKAETPPSTIPYVSSFILAWQGAGILWFGFTYGTSYIVFVPLLISLILIYIAQLRSVKATEDKLRLYQASRRYHKNHCDFCVNDKLRDVIANFNAKVCANDKPVSKGKKIFFRVFYPLHLVLLTTIRGLLMGWRPW